MGRIIMLLLLIFLTSSGNSQNPIIDSLRTKLVTTEKDSSRIEIISALMVNYRYINYDSSYYYAKWLNNYAKEIGNKKNESFGYQGLGIAHFLKENNDSAFFYFNKAFIVAENAGDTIKASQYQGNIGMVHAKKGDFQKALEAYFYRLRICEKTKRANLMYFIILVGFMTGSVIIKTVLT